MLFEQVFPLDPGSAACEGQNASRSVSRRGVLNPDAATYALYLLLADSEQESVPGPPRLGASVGIRKRGKQALLPFRRHVAPETEKE
jgi:hypothetical protein